MEWFLDVISEFISMFNTCPRLIGITDNNEVLLQCENQTVLLNKKFIKVYDTDIIIARNTSDGWEYNHELAEKLLHSSISYFNKGV